jgi:hypothetical protein
MNELRWHMRSVTGLLHFFSYFIPFILYMRRPRTPAQTKQFDEVTRLNTSAKFRKSINHRDINTTKAV